VQKKKLCTKSEYFQAAFGGDFAEASKKEIQLPEDDANAVGCFLEWIYQNDKKIPLDFHLPSDDRAIYLKKTLYPAFLFAEKYCIVDFQNAVIDIIQMIHYREETLVDTEDIAAIYHNTREGSKLRLFCVALVAWAICDESFRPEGKDINEDQLRGFAELSQNVTGFTFDLLCFQAEYGAVFYEDPAVIQEAARTTDMVMDSRRVWVANSSIAKLLVT